jgi:hypothetical protein
MERHLSAGVTTIVALMAAHRAAAGREGAPVSYCQEEVAQVDAYLHEDEPAVPAATASSLTARRRRPGRTGTAILIPCTRKWGHGVR